MYSVLPVQLCFTNGSCCRNVSKHRRVWGFTGAAFLFHTPTPSQKTSQHVSHIEKSKQHKHYQQTWGRTMIQRKPAPVGTKSTSSLLTSNCWWHQSSLPDCLVRDQASSAQMQSRYRENRPTVRHTQPLVRFEKAKDEDERDGQSRRGRQSEG